MDKKSYNKHVLNLWSCCRLVVQLDAHHALCTTDPQQTAESAVWVLSLPARYSISLPR